MNQNLSKKINNKKNVCKFLTKKAQNTINRKKATKKKKKQVYLNSNNRP